jgi:hypothetical protein
VSDLQAHLDHLTRSRPGPGQVATFEGVTRFRAHGRKHGGRTFEIHDFAQGREAPLGSPLVDERRFVEASGCFWRYRFRRTEAPVADISSLERQLAAGVYTNQDDRRADVR